MHAATSGHRRRGRLLWALAAALLAIAVGAGHGDHAAATMTVGTGPDWDGAVAATRHPRWAALEGAQWIWRDSTSFDHDKALLSKPLIIPGLPAGGTVELAADDFVVLFVNGQAMLGHPAGEGEDGAGRVKSYDIGAALRPGINTLILDAYNGPAAAGQGDDRHAGVLARFTIRYHPSLSAEIRLDLPAAFDCASPGGAATVTVLSQPGFDPATADQGSVRFGPGRVKPQGAITVGDANGDGVADLAYRFDLALAGIACGDRWVGLDGTAADLTLFTALAPLSVRR